jgi:UDP-glucose 4-epimerase
MIRKMKNKEGITIFGKDKLLDFTYIDDCVSGIIKCIENFSATKNNVFNIASGKGSKLIDVARIIKEKMNSESQIIIDKNRPGEVVRYIADISKAKKILGYKPSVDLKRGLELSIDWYKNHE